MSTMLENYGLGFLKEDENLFMNVLKKLVSESKSINGYYGAPYLFTPTGCSEFWVNTEKTNEGDLRVNDFNIHCGGTRVWEMVHSGIDISPKDGSKLERTIMFDKCQGKECFLPVEIITADVLPSFLKGDRYNIQVVALPLDINYYADEEEYEKDQPDDPDGKKWLVANGSLCAFHFISNHSVNTYEQGKEYESDKYIHFTATVKKLYHGTFELGGETHKTFIRCIAETQYGELEFDHTYQQVSEEQRCNIKEGAVISGVCMISGDVAIDKYDEGIIKDFEHDLKLIRYTVTKGETERLACVLDENVVCEINTHNKKVCGVTDTINHFTNLHSEIDGRIASRFAKVTRELNGFPAGTQCVLFGKEDEDFSNVVLIDVNDEGLIVKIIIDNIEDYADCCFDIVKDDE